MSDYDLTQLGVYQFRNLVRSGVPFLLVHETGDFLKVFSVTEKMTLGRWAVVLDFAGPANDLWTEISERGVPKEMPVVLLPSEAGRSEKLLSELEKRQFLQVFEVRGGWKGLLADSAES